MSYTINPPPLKVPEKLQAVSPGFWKGLIETVRLLWFNDRQRRFQVVLSGACGIAGSTVSVAHGVDSASIYAVYGVIFTASGVGVPVGASNTGNESAVSFDSSNVTVAMSAGNSSNVVGKPFNLVIEYR